MADVNLLPHSVLPQKNKPTTYQWGVIASIGIAILLFQVGWNARVKAKMHIKRYQDSVSELNSKRYIPSALTAFSIHEIKMVGYIKKNEKAYGVVLLPNKILTDVSLGEVVGSEEAVITRVTQEKIIAKKGQLIFSIFSRGL